MIKRIARFFRPALVLLAVFLVFGLVIVAYHGVRTLQQLTAIEAERDQWQRPSEIIHALDLRSGYTVVDLGCGSGYFALKLSPVVGPEGAVMAIDIRRLPLNFLWIRTLLKRQNNVRTILGEPENPHLPSGTADAVLIANTYHELENRDAILNQVFQSLVLGGHLVIVDPLKTEHGNTSLASVEDELRSHSFEILTDNQSFLDQPGSGQWWLITARKVTRR